MIALIHKYAPITFIEHLSHQVKDIWSLVSNARVPIYLETSSAQFISFSAFITLLELTKRQVPESEFISLVRASSKAFVDKISSDTNNEKSMSGLCSYIPVNALIIDERANEHSLKLELQSHSQSLFLGELYLLSVVHCYYQSLASNVNDPIKYHLQHPDASDLALLKINHQTPQFLGQGSTALFYKEPIQSELSSQCDYPVRFQSPDLSCTQQITAILEGYIGREDISIEQLSQIIDVNARTIQRRLKSEGNTFRKIKESLNIAFAKRVMVQRKASISDVAEHLGYSNTSQFIRAFRKAENTTPLQWLKKHQKP